MPKLFEVQVIPKNLYPYKDFDSKIYKELLAAAKKLKTKNIVHINAASNGGGVAEILRSQIALEKTLGIKSHWLEIKAPKTFFQITKKLHNFLQGKSGNLTQKEKNYYLSVNHKLGKSLLQFLNRLEHPAIIVMHDPQPLPIINFIPKHFSCILRFHVDLSTPNLSILEFLKPFIAKYSKVVLSAPKYSQSLPWLPKSKIKIIMPSIDPLSEKNREMNEKTAKSILRQFSISPAKPILAQVSRFDLWKDPLGVIKIFYLAKDKIPDLQLILAGFFTAKDDPEAISVFKQVKKLAKGNPDIFLFSSPKKLRNISNDIFINAVYTASTVIIQKSIKEGFGLTITEAMWKRKAVVAGRTTGTMIQIKNNKNGLLIYSPEEAAKAVIRLIQNEKLRKVLGRNAHNSVKQRFLLMNFLRNNLKLYSGIIR